MSKTNKNPMSASDPAHRHLENILAAITNGESEESNRKLTEPFFLALFGDQFKTQDQAAGADGYVEGKLVIELKNRTSDWMAGLYQGLHYLKKGLSFHSICVVSNNFIGLWKLDRLPKEVLKLAKESDAHKAPSTIGPVNARKTNRALGSELLKAASFQFSPDQGMYSSSPRSHLSEWLQQLRNLEARRVQINTTNFIDQIDLMKDFFNDPIDAIHAFYSIVATWDVTSIVTRDESGEHITVTSVGLGRNSESVPVPHRNQERLIEFIKGRYIFTNEGSGLTVDYYFSRFDEVLARIKPEYARQHGIFFTDINLSKFALWFIHRNFEKRLGEKYIVVDPAGGSGNLVTSWKGHLKHKIVSELQPDLLKTIERRMRFDSEESRAGFTIIPRTSENIGLNFLNKSAEDYYEILKGALRGTSVAFDKPIAFLLNPPYKNTDENSEDLVANEAHYKLDEGITAITGDDAGKERYLAFLAQILQICSLNAGENPGTRPLVMVFTPTSWLIPRKTYVPFRERWDQWFKYENGFLVTSNEFFEISGRWPLSFTIWSYNPKLSGNQNQIEIKDYTSLKGEDFAGFDWNDTLQNIEGRLRELIKGKGNVNLSSKAQTLYEWCGQARYDFMRSRTQSEIGSPIAGGLPLGDQRRNNSKTYGRATGLFVGQVDDLTPVRLTQDLSSRMSQNPDRVWFRLDNSFADSNKSRIQSGPSDNRSYCAFDLESARKTFGWYGVLKATNGRNPIWANQLDCWVPSWKPGLEDVFYRLCYALGFADNSCIVTRFEANNPIAGVPELLVDNPMSPNNPESFWSSCLGLEVDGSPPIAKNLVAQISDLYRIWKRDYCKGSTITDVGLKNEPYFALFNYVDFLTPNSGLVQIKKYAENQQDASLLFRFESIRASAKAVRDELLELLVSGLGYFS